jgi:myo-inositol 2-dehydrogenase / D-chiro-inositol 1-dehydrogenase
MASAVRIGFIGCGGNARGHMKRVQEVAGAKIVAVCDVVEELVTKAGEETASEAYTDHRRLLDRQDLDAVYISIPVYAHGDPELDTIDRGLPFLVEKPVAREMSTARKIEKKVRDSGLITAVGYQLRYAATGDAAREILAGRTIGLVNGKYWCNSGVGDPSRWLRQMAKSGGQLVEQATHTVDMMRFLAGEVTEVYCASTSQLLKEIDCPDFNAVSLKFANGAVGTLTTSWAFAQGWGNANVVDILFEDALLNWTHGKLTIYRNGEIEEISKAGPGIDEVFVNAVRTGDAAAIRSPYSDAVTSLALTLAMNVSAEENRPVRIEEMG